MQKSANQRWNNGGDGKSKELKATTDAAEDEKDPDVIPHGKKVANASSVHYGECRWCALKAFMGH
jgi:hypothetical protein